MGVGTHNKSGQDILNDVSAEHGTGTVGNPAGLRVLAKYVAAPTAVPSGSPVVFWADALSYQTPHLDVYLLDSQTSASGSGVGSAKTGLGAFSKAALHLNITAAGGGTSTADRSLTVYLQSRFDGTNWDDIAAFSATGSVNKKILVVNNAQVGSGDVAITATVGAGTVRLIGFADDFRVRREISGTSPLFDYVVYLNAVA